MDNDRLWQLIEQARLLAADPTDAEEVASHAATLLADHPPAEILQGVCSRIMMAGPA
ncbi:hypothetical protein ACIPRL_37300 [Streptomyces sp. NPDC090085]|uniref:hypothetical protein n=1 Tax=Streptomyces sp. NPDC090085 TaxID=3365943 RepID=UPI003827C859